MSHSERLPEVRTADPLLLTPEEAAQVLRLGRTTIYALIKEGALRPVHIGRSCRLSRAELERYVRRLESPPLPHPVQRRVPARRGTTAAQHGLPELAPDSVDER